MKKLILFSLIIGSAGVLQAQESNKVLPNGMTPAEEQLMKSGLYVPPGTGRGVTTPPGFAARTMAEWEEIQTLVITWTGFPVILAQIVDAAQEECEVLIACSDSTAVKSYLTSASVPLTNVSYLEVPFNSIWIRDYGAHTIYKDDVDSLCLVDWIYNRPRPDDDLMPEAHATQKGITLFSTTNAPNDLMNTGGNWMVDGFGTAFASELILDENDGNGSYSLPYPTHTSAQIDQIMNDYMGINRYIKMPTLPYDGIHHIDMHMKLIDEETLLVSEYPAGVADGPQIEANLQYVVSTYNSMYGTPYKVVRIPSPPDNGGQYPGPNWWSSGDYLTYSNNVFVNKTLIVPFYRQEYDTIAQRILSQALPGYNIVGIDCDNSNSNIIAQSGAIHCITNAIGVSDPLLIRHQSLTDTYDDQNPYTVDAFIKHRSGISSATLYWSLTSGSGYTSVAMTATGNDMWTAQIPAQAAGSTIYYYIEGNAVSGKSQVRPIVAPNGNFHFKVLMPVTVPEVSLPASIDKIYPNPANAITCVEANVQDRQYVHVYLTDMLGRRVEEIYAGEKQGTPARFFIHADRYEAGSYQVVLETDQSRSVHKLVIR